VASKTTKKSKPPSLVAFARERAARRGPNCWLCRLPERAFVEKEKRDDPSISVIAIVEYLRDALGYKKATYHRVENHFRLHVRRDG